MSEKKLGRGSRLIKNILLLFTSSFVTRILSFLLVPFYTSILSTADYGVADLINTTVLLFLPIFSLLMDEAIMRFALEVGSNKKQIFTIALMLSTIGFMVAMCFSPIILFFDSLRPYYWFVVLYYVSSWLYNIFSFYIRGLDKVTITTIAGIIHTFAYLIINILCLAILKFGVYGYLLAIDISNLIAAAFLFFYCKLYKNFISIKKFDWQLAKQMIKYSTPLIPNYISGWINSSMDRYILSFFCGNSAVGLYSVAHKIPSILHSMTNIFASAWRISSVDNFGSKESIEFYNKIYRLYSGFLVVGAGVITLLTQQLASILFAKDFYISWKITPILIFAYIINAMALFFESVFTASKRTGKLFYAALIGAVVNIVLNLILIPVFAGIGAAIATALGYLVMWIVQMLNTKHIIKMNFNLKILIPSLLLLFFEIIAVMFNNLQGYIIAVLCLFFIIAINFKIVIYLIGFLLKKIKK